MRRTSAVVATALAVTLTACSGGTSADQAGGTGGEVAATSPPEDPATTTSPEGSATQSAAPAPGDGDDAATTSEAPVELPRGGREIFPDFRLVGYVGHPDSAGMGRLGIGDPDERADEIETELADFAGDREMLPVLELVVSIAHPVPGADGTYRTHVPDQMIDDFLALARRHDALLLLNIQTGAVPFPEEVPQFEEWLVEPDVGVALDPEWAVQPGQVPGQVYGSTTGAELDEVAAYLADLVDEHDLPEKAMVYHQVASSVVREESGLTEHDGVVAIKSVDGIGHPLDKVATYERVTESTPEHVHGGFKLFLEEDVEFGPLMTPEEVAELDPEVEYLMVE
ncbi:hypothetical protein [Serinicoccus kebangsaanensis]|uniref:hypothetical protein n=1 Tax=Serinicoccus kebangsaanensis TaxID=2602069 RepID=UPI00192DD132|nr:hypothetical protein [Serinicoccus kebangsaanensis]